MQQAVLATASQTRSIAIYEWISHLDRPRSFMGKLFLVSFVGTHLPLLAFVAYVLAASDLAIETLWGPMLVMLVATMIAFAITLFFVHHLLAPVRLVSSAMDTYVKTRALPKLPLHHGDDMGILMRNVQSALDELDFALRSTDAKANHDFLTGLGNKRWISSRGAFAFDQARRRDEKLSVIVFDIDHFKDLNDSHGHALGDTVLEKVGILVRDHLRAHDIAGRIGGEEFCVLAIGCDALEAVAIAERMRMAFADHNFQLPDARQVTASFGVAEMAAGTETLDAVIALADEALYEAKKDGRDRTVCAR